MTEAPAKFTPTPHPVLKLPTREQALAMGAEKLREVLMEREKIIQLEKHDPLQFGYEPDNWKDADKQLAIARRVCIFGGNRAGKTEYCVKRPMQILATRPGVNALFLHNNDLSSKQVHQRYCYRYMPPQWRNLPRRRNTPGNISYDPKNGFSDNIFTTPLDPPGTCIFGNYGQELSKYEGLEFDVIVGDEFLSLLWYRALLRGLATRGGFFLWPFTPIHGMTPAVAEVAGGARTLESKPVDPELLNPNERHVEDCPIGHMPYIAEKGKVRIIYFHSQDNAFGGYENLKELYGDADKQVRERRFYGYARRLIRVLFPKFGQRNIMKLAQVMEFLKRPVTRYHIADPAGARNMFMIWVAVDEDGRHLIYREWPDVPSHGEWAVQSEDAKRWDGEPGPAQPTLGFGVVEYKALILQKEGWIWKDPGWERLPDKYEVIFERRMDPRSGAAQSVAERDGGSSLMDRFSEEQTNIRGIVDGPPLYFEAAPGLPENDGMFGNQEGVQGINDLLAYDTSLEITPLLNEPMLYVSEECENFIWAMQNYTGHDGAKAACKDPIDCGRYMATSNFGYVTPQMMRTRGGGSY